MGSIEDQIREDVTDSFYGSLDKNMSLGCGQPFKLELIRFLKDYDDDMKKHFESFHKSVLNSKRNTLKELKKEADELLKSEELNNFSVQRLCDKIKDLNF